MYSTSSQFYSGAVTIRLAYTHTHRMAQGQTTLTMTCAGGQAKHIAMVSAQSCTYKHMDGRDIQTQYAPIYTHTDQHTECHRCTHTHTQIHCMVQAMTTGCLARQQVLSWPGVSRRENVKPKTTIALVTIYTAITTLLGKHSHMTCGGGAHTQSKPESQDIMHVHG